MIGLFARPAPLPEPAYATILLSAHQSAQGPVLQNYRDGRVAIDTGQGRVVGRPLGGPQAAQMPEWTPLFCGMI